LLYFWKWDGFGLAPELWAVILLVTASAIALAMALTRADAAFLLVIAWAFVGIAVKQAAVPLVANTALVLAVLVLFMIPLGFRFRRGNAMTQAFALNRR
jgi:hypothetical protein